MQPIYLGFLISVPQTFLIIKLGFGLFNFQISSMKCLLVSLVIAGVDFYFSTLSIPYAFNTLSLTVLTIIITSLSNKINLKYSIVSILLGLTIYASVEGLILPLFLTITDNTLSDFLASPQLNILAFIPAFLVTFFLYWMSRRFEIIVFDFGNRGDDS